MPTLARSASSRSRWRGVRSALIGVAAAMWLAAGAVAGGPGELTDDVQRLINARKFGTARVGVSVLDAESGAVLADVRAGEAFTPASNMKLLTSGAALMVLGEEFSFRTELARDGDRVIVRGGGDPALADPVVLGRMEPKMDVGRVMDVLTGAVAKTGMREVREIVVDDRIFDREFVPASWPVDQLNRGYAAETSGLNFHANILSVFTAPGAAGVGGPAGYDLEPDARWLPVEVKARTVGQGKNSAWVTREPGANRFTLRGDVQGRSRAAIEVTLHDPAMFFGHLLAQDLATAGVRVGGRGTMPGEAPAGVRLAGADETLPAGKTIAVIRTPIAEVLSRCNSDSENLYAESLMKRMGHEVTKEPGSWSNGAAVVRMMLTQRLGADAATGTTIVDGSGLSRGNRVAPATLTRWLGELSRDETTRDVFTASLAEPGAGTLKKRFLGARLGNKLRAKSGFINGVRCLSGYVTHEGTGRRLCFSVMVNDIASDEQHAAAIELHEEVVKTLDAWLTAKVAAEAPVVGV